VPLSTPRHRSARGTESTLGSPLRRPSTAVKPWRFLSQALAPFQSFTSVPPRIFVTPRGITPTRPFRGFFPFSVCQSRGATYPRRFPPRRLRCALRVSHPLDALLPSRPPGLIPSRYRSWGLTLRGLNPRLMPYALSSAAPLRGFASTKRRGRPSRDTHTKQSPPSGLGISQAPFDACLLGLSRSEVSCSQQWMTR
jgi:hypothetical protein